MKRLNQNILENLIYLIIWLVVFIIPIFGMKNDEGTNWVQVRYYWGALLPFFILFLINNYFFIPYYLLKKRSWRYLLVTFATLLIMFVAFPMLITKHRNYPPPPPQHIRNMHNPHFKSGEKSPHPHHAEKGLFFLCLPIRIMPLLNDCIIGIFIIGFNIAIRFLFKSIRDERQIKELENHTLQAELNYLKAQINPHFFMNTLNNIHALVDIDTEKAKETVIELSKIMRYVLYDANQSKISLAKEIVFLENYINLMRIRFTDHTEIKISLPEIIPDVKIAPLMLVTFIENAFKHGISHKLESYIYAALSVDEDKLYYTVTNSITSSHDDKHSGVGMENLKKRLSLLYGENYTLEIHEDTEKYNVSLIIPVDR